MWLDDIRSAPATSAPGFTPRQVRSGGRLYVETLSGGSRTDAYETPGVVVGYVGTDDTPWYAGKTAQIYDLNGNQTGQFEIANPKGRDLGEMLAIGIIGSIATAGLMQAAGGLTGAADSAAAAATPTQAGPTLSKAALDGTNAFGANSIAGAYAIPTASAAAAGPAVASLSGTFQGALGTVKSALGLGAAAAGLTGGSSSSSGGTGGTSGGASGVSPSASRGASKSQSPDQARTNGFLIAAAIGLAVAAVFS